MNLPKIKNWIKSHKGATIGIIIGIVVVGIIILTILTSLGGARYAKRVEVPYGEKGGALREMVPGMEMKEPSPGVPEVEVKEGSMEIKSKDAEADFEKTEQMAKEYRGYIERSTKRITDLYISIEATIRVPPEKFVRLIEELKKELKVESYSIKNYRIAIERELDELEILRRSLSDYERIREEIGKMGIGKEKIELLMQLTDKELELKQKERNFKRELSAKERMGEFATLNVTIKQDKAPKVWPENIINRFKERIKRALDKVVNILINLAGGVPELIFGVIQVVVYLFIVGIILAGAYKLAYILYRKFWKR